MTTCISLAERFSEKYRITFDPAIDPHGKHRDKIDPWLIQIPCCRGTIYPFGGDTLAVEIDGHQLIVGQLKRLACCRVHQLGDHDATFLFDVADFDAVAAIVLPHRKPQLTEAQKAEAAERLKRYAFKPAVTPHLFDAHTGVESKT